MHPTDLLLIIINEDNAVQEPRIFSNLISPLLPLNEYLMVTVALTSFLVLILLIEQMQIYSSLILLSKKGADRYNKLNNNQ